MTTFLQYTVVDLTKEYKNANGSRVNQHSDLKLQHLSQNFKHIFEYQNNQLLLFKNSVFLLCFSHTLTHSSLPIISTATNRVWVALLRPWVALHRTGWAKRGSPCGLSRFLSIRLTKYKWRGCTITQQRQTLTLVSRVCRETKGGKKVRQSRQWGSLAATWGEKKECEKKSGCVGK